MAHGWPLLQEYKELGISQDLFDMIFSLKDG